jgi:tRNA (mo5U34)-methyltransferase
MEPISALAKRIARQARAAARRRLSPLPARGYDSTAVPAPLLDRLSDDDLAALNHLLPWSCFTVDGRGRRFGDAAWTGKREGPQLIPDPRIVLMHERFGLEGKHVLEIGCFEGVHTIALCQRAGRVTAVDSRTENVVKTIVRTSLYGCHPDVFPVDVDSATGIDTLAGIGADFVHHVGVLYHLLDPVRHVLALGRVAGSGVMLDTHVSAPADATEVVAVDGEQFKYRRYREQGRADVFSGMHDHAKWLTEATLVDLLARAGFSDVDVVERRAERHGPRVLILAQR